MAYLTIGILAKKAGVATETIRYYERSQLLPPAERLQSGYRVYGTDTVKRIRFIKQAQALGFTLNEIMDLLALTDNDDTDCAAINAAAKAKLTEIDQKIKALQKMQNGLSVLAERCPGDDKPLTECSIINHLYGKDPSDE